MLYTVLGCFFILLLSGQAALGKAYVENRLRLHPAGCLAGLIAICFGFLLVLAFVLLPRSYTDYFVLQSLIFPLGWSWWMAGCLAFALAQRTPSTTQWRHKRVYGVVVGSLLMLAGIWGITRLAENVQALISGPAYASGILQDMHWSGGRGSQYFAQIDNSSYLIPNPTWLAAYQRGQAVQFAYSNTSTRIAVAPSNIRVSILGGCLIGLAMFAWIVTLLGAGEGYRSLWREFHRHIPAPATRLEQLPVQRRAHQRIKLSRRQRRRIKRMQ